ncbi:16S rRNA (guanine(1207)-N(2))-methyltransferase RsmC [Candidatus Williamhamiltonella defendens]|uniref:16S rRNA (guanine(1207)-N(2))-methyltransferase RsmC n=1 Tax=Candidatus Williamhamiltonella defendens TaxID=138072 RepID=UPI00130D774C|nr:16S rRNA (guanine(1207)-N(2))-methyltransferase RsmC [Candidatus Hamiltonella defensa]
MSDLTPPSEILLRHTREFSERSVIFAGDLQDLLPAQFNAKQIRVHTQEYHHWRLLSPVLKNNIQFGLLPSEDLVYKTDTVIFYWPKNKAQAQFQLEHLCSLLPSQTNIFIVGENRSGIGSAKDLLAENISLHKMDAARHCRLYYGYLKQKSVFNMKSQWRQYQVQDVQIKTLPGVFSANQLDEGSQLLLSSFDMPLSGKVLDLACGAGVLGIILARQSPHIKLTLSDANAAALESSRANLAWNHIKARVVPSDLYSNIPERFNLILSNLPFHKGLQTDLKMIKKCIDEAPGHLYKNGKLRLVANAFLPYPQLLNRTFGHYEVLTQNARFKIYQATL